MPAATPKYGFPYPLPTEPVAEGAQAIRNLAESLDAARELQYQEMTGQLVVTQTTDATAQGVIGLPSVAYAAVPTILEFFTPNLTKGTAWIRLGFWDGATFLGIAAHATAEGPALIRRRITPTAGAHAFSVKTWVNVGPGYVNAGPGGANYVPAYFRTLRA